MTVARAGDVGPSGLMLEWDQARPALGQAETSIYQFAYEPAGARYHKLLSVALRYCAYGLLVLQDFSWKETATAAIEDLEKWRVQELTGSEWPGTKTSKPARLNVLRFDSGLCAVLQRLTRRLYQWQQPDLPEDLCLFRASGEPWLVSIAHEADGWLLLRPNETRVVVEAMRPLRLIRSDLR